MVAAAGKFGVDLLTNAALQMTRGESRRKLESWGMAYCYGNRLEAVKVGLEAGERPGFDRLSDVRTDMAMLALGLPGEGEAGLVQPLLRKERKQMWAFCLNGTVSNPVSLDVGRLRPEGESPAEWLFLHVLNRFNAEDPVESVRTALEAMEVESELDFLLLNADMLVVARWAGSSLQGEGEIWLGQGPLLRIVAPTPLRELERVEWVKMPDRSVAVISRLRRPIS
jgi:hypothetical protein